MATVPGAPPPETANKHIVALLREELHKLEYSYARKNRLGPPEKAVGKAVLPRAMQERLTYLTERKASMEADLKNLTAERNAIKDRKTQYEIGTYLDRYDQYYALIRQKIFKMKELHKNNTSMLQLIAELSTEINRRNAILQEQTTRFETQKGQLEGRIHWAQLSLNRVTADNNQLRKDICDSMTHRKILYDMYMKRNNEHLKLKKQLHKKATFGCNVFRALRYGENRMERKLAKHNRKFVEHHINMEDLYLMAGQKLTLQAYFDTIRAERDMIVDGKPVEYESPLDKEYKAARIKNKRLQRSHKRILKENENCMNLEQVAKLFEETDGDNFQLVFDIVETDAEIYELSKTNREMVKSIDDYYATFPGVAEGTLTYEEELDQTQFILATTAEDLETRSHIVDVAQHCLDLLLPALQDTFELMGADSVTLSQFLGAKKGFNANSIDVCLQLMENRVQNLLYEKQYYETWKELGGDEASRPLPEMIFGSPPAAGGIVSPDVPVAAITAGIGQGISDLLQQDVYADLLDVNDARIEAREKVHKQNEQQRDAERHASVKRQESANKRKAKQQEQANKLKSKSTVSVTKSRSQTSVKNTSSTKLKTSNKSSTHSISRPTSATSLKK